MKDKKDKLKAKLPRGFKDNQEDVMSLRNAESDVIKNECQKLNRTNEVYSITVI